MAPRARHQAGRTAPGGPRGRTWFTALGWESAQDDGDSEYGADAWAANSSYDKDGKLQQAGKSG
eukprot:11966203-Heterocapsa_arctica.AAC.1